MCASSTLAQNAHVLVASHRLVPNASEVAESAHASDIDDGPGQLHAPLQSVPRPGTVWNEDMFLVERGPRRCGSGSIGTTDSDRHPAPPTSGVPWACAGAIGAYPALSLRSTSKSRPHPVQRMRATYSVLSTTGAVRNSSGSSAPYSCPDADFIISALILDATGLRQRQLLLHHHRTRLKWNV